MVPRHLAIGDIHGCYDALVQLVDFVGLEPDDIVVTLGDYCNRGPNTKGVIDWLIEMDNQGQLRPLRGNHEIMTLSARDNPGEMPTWLQVGGNKTLASYAPDANTAQMSDIPPEHWDFIENRLLPYYECSTHFFVHANAYPDLPLDQQPDYMLYWERYNHPRLHDSSKVMVCGHASQKSGYPISNGSAICIDSAVYRTGWLTCLDVGSGQVWQANGFDTRTFGIDQFTQD